VRDHEGGKPCVLSSSHVLSRYCLFMLKPGQVILQAHYQDMVKCLGVEVDKPILAVATTFYKDYANAGYKYKVDDNRVKFKAEDLWNDLNSGINGRGRYLPDKFVTSGKSEDKGDATEGDGLGNSTKRKARLGPFDVPLTPGTPTSMGPPSTPPAKQMKVEARTPSSPAGSPLGWDPRQELTALQSRYETALLEKGLAEGKNKVLDDRVKALEIALEKSEEQKTDLLNRLLPLKSSDNEALVVAKKKK